MAYFLKRNFLLNQLNKQTHTTLHFTTALVPHFPCRQKIECKLMASASKWKLFKFLLTKVWKVLLLTYS